MSISSPAELRNKKDEWTQTRAILLQHNVPEEAWPQHVPTCFSAYEIRSTLGPSIQVLALRRAFTLYEPGANRSTFMPWGTNATAAWDRARSLAGWFIDASRKPLRPPLTVEQDNRLLPEDRWLHTAVAVAASSSSAAAAVAAQTPAATAGAAKRAASRTEGRGRQLKRAAFAP